MLVDQAGFLEGTIIGTEAGGEDWLHLQLTWNGHEFLDAVRHPEVWRKAKDGASKIGSASVGILLEIAKAYVKQLAKEKLGLMFE